ncbi:MAG: hypothetical protein KBT11_05525 [Treponema sp.]|nr:hypothetical protein [Candidatus Treponema equifaecale]
MKKRWAVLGLSFALFFCSVAGAFGKSVSIQIIQNHPGQEKVWMTSYLFEQCITDYFFENGQIVSSSPVWINSSEDKNKGALRASLKENLDGGMEYLVRVELIYKPAKQDSNPDAFLLENIQKVQWKTYNVRTGLEVANGSAMPDSVTSQNNNEAGLADLAGFAAYKINSGLKNLK